MQGRGVPPSVVEDTIKTGQPFAAKYGRQGYYSPQNNMRVIVEPEGSIVTVIPGAP